MSVIVMGMEMPERCETCDLICDDDSGLEVCCCTGEIVDREEQARPRWCPLRPLPEKHGRLIEDSHLKDTLDYYIREAGWDAKTNRVLGWVKDDFIDSEPTIVEAEGE